MINRSNQRVHPAVFNPEPFELPKEHQGLRNLVLTPHSGARTLDALNRSSVEAVDKLIAYYRNGTITNSLPPLARWFQH